MCIYCQAGLIIPKHLKVIIYILLFQKVNHIWLPQIKMELWELERFCFETNTGSVEGDSLRFTWVTFSFLPAVHILLIGQDMSALYCWNSELNQFSFVLEAPSAYDAASVTVKSLNSSKNLIALVGTTHSHIYELIYISSQSDFIPRYVQQFMLCVFMLTIILYGT